MRDRWKGTLYATALAVAAVGCSTEIRVESNTSWSGYIGGDAGASYDGSGNQTFKVDPGVCWSFQKQTTQGTLRAYAVEKTIVSSSRAGDATTTAQYGIVTGCTT